MTATTENVVSLDEWRARRLPPEPPPPAAPRLRLVDPEEPNRHAPFTLEAFLARARVIVAETGSPGLRLVSAPVIELPTQAPAQAG